MGICFFGPGEVRMEYTRKGMKGFHLNVTRSQSGEGKNGNHVAGGPLPMLVHVIAWAGCLQLA